MVGKNQDFVLATFQIVSPSFKSLNNCWKLTVVGFVPSLSRDHFSQKIGHGVPLALIGGQVIRSQLTYDSSYSLAGSVGLNPDMTFQIKMSKDQSFGKQLPQLVKTFPSAGN